MFSSEYHIKQAVAKAFNNLQNNKLKSKNFYNDIMYCMQISGFHSFSLAHSFTHLLDHRENSGLR